MEYKRARLFWFAVTAALLTVASACSSSSPTAEEEVPVDSDTSVAVGGEQIISLSPTATEILFEIGAGNQVVAVDAFSDFPPDAPSDQRLDAFNPDLEVILSYEPTVVVVGVDSPELTQDLADREVEVLLQPTADSVQAMFSQIEELGEISGQVEQAVQLNENIESSISDARVLLENASGSKIYHEVAQGNSGFFYHHEETFLGNLYSELGLEVVGDSEALVDNEISAEVIIASAPDIILLNGNDFSAGVDDIANRAGWGTVPAVVDEQIFVVDADTSSRSGPRIIDYLDQLLIDLSSIQ